MKVFGCTLPDCPVFDGEAPLDFTGFGETLLTDDELDLDGLDDAELELDLGGFGLLL